MLVVFVVDRFCFRLMAVGRLVGCCWLSCWLLMALLLADFVVGCFCCYWLFLEVVVVFLMLFLFLFLLLL